MFKMWFIRCIWVNLHFSIEKNTHTKKIAIKKSNPNFYEKNIHTKIKKNTLVCIQTLYQKQNPN